jgi:uncharacterized protein (TIGR02284 family)
MGTFTLRRSTGSHLSQIRRLVVACNDDAHVHDAAALVVRGDGGIRLAARAARRLCFAHDLAAMVWNFGGPPDHGPSTRAMLRGVARQVRSWIVGENAGDAYTACACAEARTEKLYEAALEADLPRATKDVVARQLREVASDRLELRRLSMGGEGVEPSAA